MWIFNLTIVVSKFICLDEIILKTCYRTHWIYEYIYISILQSKITFDNVVIYYAGHKRMLIVKKNII